MASVFVPVLYLVLVIGSLGIFSYFYRKRAAKRQLEPYFPSHVERNQYITLLQQTDPPANETLLKAALLRRAVADVQRILKIREDKPALQLLLQKGSVGDDLWNSLLAAEKEMEAEILEVVAEANTFVEGWGQIIFQTASEMINNEKIRGVIEASAKARAEKEAKYGKQTKKAIAAGPETLPQSPKPSAPLQPASPPLANANGLTPPSAPGADSGNESERTRSPSPSSPKSPSKSSNKKGKKRK
ncbi:hypothetical protein GLOTRDRAFT_126847 [Gloeophyllum trabeum ATCC 11539]|uniref:Translocation protein sec66 n=1 Tax=Gloeophyllum trabeum (strain ATCC 11539 / FP-39264 / Madison 617) TaxID=670483 RepID=S7QFZ8_GLOTA|nr:uncharacterized protein GLOTRDRAFT_126847 [Gloeophyllum trabeum ATCC 11539]EPQ58352.1 hypothetical protein GLOTRDRAFT_126847 [Gloeophyllum trabeum ATCC 11539]